MGKKLLIAEKPSVANEFAKVLKLSVRRQNGYMESEDYIITWCVGHLVTMSYPDKYEEKLKYWSLNTLPFLPEEYKYEVIDSVSKQFEIVSGLLNRSDVDMIYVCTDSGREGEYIYRLVDKMANVTQKEKRRVWIDSQTEEAILDGIKNAKLLSEYDSLADSAYLRAKEDYLIGINFSRLLSVIYSKELAKALDEQKAVISIGRVMTCVLGMIVDREREIRNFTKTKFYRILGEFGIDENSKFDGEWKAVQGSKYFESPKLYNDTGFKDIQEANTFVEEIKTNENIPTVTEISKKNKKENAPLLYNLAELQNDCTKRFKISPDETLEIMQTLYEKKLVTYPRTDARVLSTAVAKEISKNLNGLVKSNTDAKIKESLEKMIKEKYSTDLLKTKYVNDSKITDHYAIIPTGQGFENYPKLTPLQKDVFNLVVKRFLSIFFPPAEFSRISVVVKIGEESFFSSGKICIDLGYLEVVKNVENIDVEKNADIIENKDDDENIENDKTNNIELLKKLKKGQQLELFEVKLKEGETSPPNRFTSGSIILAMENAGKLIEDEELREQIKGSGIGTSATRAEIIKKLVRIQYMALNEKTQILTPTIKGESIYDIVKKSMPDLLNAELTASWEKGLSMIAKNEIKADLFMDKLEKYIKDKVNRLKDKFQYW
ncbi:MAG: DNA topoisomerase [Clostridia bacterium]|nr:DNA topoisomerase [Clostridia bacterium]